MSDHKPISAYLRHILAAGVRFCLRHSIKLQDIIECLKQLLVEIAEEQLRSSGEEPNDSKLSLMTGVHRKDVTRLRKGSQPKKRSGDLITRIMGQWQNDKRFSGIRGKPRTLSFEGGEGEFAELVRSVSREIKPYSILAEMDRIGLVKRTSRGVKLVTPLYNIKGDPEEGFRFLEEDTEDLYMAVEENIFARQEIPNLHIKTQYDKVPADKLGEIREWLIKEGSSYHQRARNYLSQYDRDINKSLGDSSETVRVAVASFSIVDRPKSAPSEEIPDETENN